MAAINRQYKDRLFRFLFSESKEAALSLYNALNNSSYTNAEDLEFTTIDDVLYLGMKNDLSILFQLELDLYEHQSTENPNLPLRGFLYLPKLFEALLRKRGANIYGSRLIKLPTPHYIVFYNGLKDARERYELRLSDAFEKPGGCVEVVAEVININAGRNRELLKRCRRLGDYAELVSRIRDNQAKGMEIEKAVEAAVNSCIQDGVLVDFLVKHKAEAVGMLLTEYNEAETMEMFREEAFEEGLEKGLEKGRKEEHINTLLQNIRTLSGTTGWGLERVFSALGVSTEERESVSALLGKQQAEGLT